MGGPGPGAQIHVSHFIDKKAKGNNEPHCWHSESLLAKMMKLPKLEKVLT